MKRYDPAGCECCRGCDTSAGDIMLESPDGDWVRYEDVQAALRAASELGWKRGCEESRAVVKGALIESTEKIVAEGKAAISEARAIGRWEGLSEGVKRAAAAEERLAVVSDRLTTAVLPKHALSVARDSGTLLYTSHFATCPKAAQHRTPKAKADYVRGQPQSRPHACHWPGCKEQVPPAMWGCKEHWFTLPLEIRRRIWAAYRPGQERDGKPSDEYLKAAQAAQDWIAMQARAEDDEPMTECPEHGCELDRYGRCAACDGRCLFDEDLDDPPH